MSDFYIYSTKYNKIYDEAESPSRSITVIYCSNDFINEKNIQNEIKLFYEKEYQTDDVIVIGCNHALNILKKVFINSHLETFKHIPKLQSEHLLSNLLIYT